MKKVWTIAARITALFSLGVLVFVGSTVGRFVSGSGRESESHPQGPQFFSPSLFSTPTALAEYVSEGSEGSEGSGSDYGFSTCGDGDCGGGGGCGAEGGGCQG